jgi:hypothetical protein
VATVVTRVVVLSTRFRLTSYLVECLALDGQLAGVIYEERFRTKGDTWRYLRRTARREGFWHTLDALAYEVWNRIARRSEFARRAHQILPLATADAMVAGTAPVYTVADHNAPDTLALIRSLEPDLLVVHACGILKPATYGLARLAAINIHCGVLPEYRGHASTFWSMFNEDADNIGVTVHLVAKTVDTGAPVGITRVPMSADDDDMTMWLKAFRAGTEIVRRVARDADHNAVPTGRYEGRTGPHYPRQGLTHHLRFRVSRLPRLRAAARHRAADASRA